MKPEFRATGDHHSDLWLVNGSPDFAIFPGGIIPGFTVDVPIRLKVGNLAYGGKHIQHRHAVWCKKQGFDSVPALVYHKLSHAGEVYSTESAGKLKIMMRLNPSALLVIEHITHPEPHFSITTLYHHQSALDGTRLGRYPGRR